MAKIGRNEACPCGSGLKHKRCCLQKEKTEETVSPMQQLKLSLIAEIEKIQRAAKQGEEIVRELGVFVLWSSGGGDAWLMEVSESDTVQVSGNGESLEFPIDENPETIEIEWSHTFDIRERQLYLTAYADKSESCLEKAPTQRINAAIRRIRKKYSEEVLSQVHVNQPEA